MHRRNTTRCRFARAEVPLSSICNEVRSRRRSGSGFGDDTRLVVRFTRSVLGVSALAARQPATAGGETVACETAGPTRQFCASAWRLGMQPPAAHAAHVQRVNSRIDRVLPHHRLATGGALGRTRPRSAMFVWPARHRRAASSRGRRVGHREAGRVPGEARWFGRIDLRRNGAPPRRTGAHTPERKLPWVKGIVSSGGQARMALPHNNPQRAKFPALPLPPQLQSLGSHCAVTHSR